ncbi:MAG: ABC transporter permease [Rhizomicrobium sp.]
MLEQILAVTVMNLKTLHTRVWSSLVIMVGVAGVVGVLVSVLAMATGLVASMEHAGRRDRIIVLRGGSDTETSSQLSRASIATILDAPGIRRDGAGKVIGSAESVTVLARPMRSGGTDANVTLRGVGTEGLALRPEIRLVAGRWFKPGLHELVVGRAAQKQFAGLEIGDRISMSGQPWPVVGVFTSGGDTHESEVLTDAETVTIALRRSLFQSVTVLLNSPGDFAAFKRALTTNPQLSVEAQPEPDYFARTSSSLTTIMHFVAYVVGSIMAVGAIFGALNTMYSAVSARSVEIATLRAIGFGGLPVVISVLVESALLSLLGGIAGAVLAWIFFDGNGVSALGGGFTQLVFHLSVTPALMIQGITWAVLIGLLGGLMPALRAARIPITDALRSL